MLHLCNHLLHSKHPTIYEVSKNGVFTRAQTLDTSAYYRWDNSVDPKTESFPPGFRMIATSTDPGANQDGEDNMYTECCNMVGDGEECKTWNQLKFPTRTCDFLGIALGESWQSI